MTFTYNICAQLIAFRTRRMVTKTMYSFTCCVSLDIQFSVYTYSTQSKTILISLFILLQRNHNNSQCNLFDKEEKNVLYRADGSKGAQHGFKSCHRSDVPKNS